MVFDATFFKKWQNQQKMKFLEITTPVTSQRHVSVSIHSQKWKE
jgi:hypothetical protein